VYKGIAESNRLLCCSNREERGAAQISIAQWKCMSSDKKRTIERQISRKEERRKERKEHVL